MGNNESDEKPKKTETAPEAQSADDAAAGAQIRGVDGAEKAKVAGLDADEKTKKEFDQANASREPGARLPASAALLAGLDAQGKKADHTELSRSGKPGDIRRLPLEVGNPAAAPTPDAAINLQKLIRERQGFVETRETQRAGRTLLKNSESVPEAQRAAYSQIGTALVLGSPAALEKALKDHAGNPGLKLAVDLLNRDFQSTGISLELKPGEKEEGKPDGPATLSVRRDGASGSVIVASDGSGKGTIPRDGKEAAATADESRQFLGQVSKDARKLLPSENAASGRDGEVGFKKFGPGEGNGYSSERRFAGRADGLEVERRLIGKPAVSERDYVGRADGVTSETQFAPNHPQGYIAERVIGPKEKPYGNEIDKWVDGANPGEKERVTVRSLSLNGQNLEQTMFASGRVVTTITPTDAAKDERKVSKTVFEPGPPEKVEAFDASGAVIKDFKPDDALGAALGPNDGIYADGRRTFATTRDQQTFVLTEFAPNDSAGRQREIKSGAASKLFMTDGSVEHDGSDERGKFVSRTWDDSVKGRLTQTLYADGGVVTTDAANKEIGVDKPVSVGNVRDTKGRDAQLMSDGTIVTDLGDGKKEIFYPKNDNSGRVVAESDEKAGTKSTTFNDGRIKTEYAAGDVASRTVHPNVKDGIREERELRATSGNRYEADRYENGAKVAVESRGKDTRGEYQGHRVYDAAGNAIQQKVYANSTLTEFEAKGKTPGTLSEKYGAIVQENGKAPVGIRWEDLNKDPKAITPEMIKPEDMKPVATVSGVDGVKRDLQLDGRATRETAQGIETLFPDRRLELLYKTPIAAKDAGVEGDGQVEKKTTYPANDPKGRSERFDFVAGSRADQTAQTSMKEGQSVVTLKEFNGQGKDGRTFEKESNGKLVESRFVDGRFVLNGENGQSASGRSEVLSLRNGEKAQLDVDDRTSRATGLRYTEGPRAGQELKFGYDDQGRLNGVVLPDGRVVKAGADGRWDADAARELGFSVEAKDGTVALRVNDKGDLVADNGHGKQQFIRADGSRDTYNNKDYSVVRESTDGQKVTEHWDGYGWRQAKSFKRDGDRVVIEFEPKEGRPILIERVSKDADETNPKLDSLKVVFADKSSYDANWTKHTQTYSDASGKVSEYVNSGQVDDNGKPIYRPGVAGKNGDYSLNAPGTSPEDQTKMQRSEIPLAVRVNEKTGDTIAFFNNGTKILSDSRNRPKTIAYGNGQAFQFNRDADGRLSGVVSPDGTSYQRRADGAVDPTGSKAERWSVVAGDPPREVGTFKGTFHLKADGTVERRQSDGNLTIHETNGRAVVKNRQGEVTEITEASGQKWHAEKIPGTGNDAQNANKRVWRKADDEKVSFTGEHKLQPDGSVSFVTSQGEFARNNDGSTSRLSDKGLEIERNWDNGAFLKRDAAGLVLQTKDSSGVLRDYEWKPAVPGTPATEDEPAVPGQGPTLLQVKSTANGVTTVEQADGNGLLRQVKNPAAKDDNEKFGERVIYGEDGSRTVVETAEGKPVGGAKTELDGSSSKLALDGKTLSSLMRRPDGYFVARNENQQITEVFEPEPGSVPPRTRSLAKVDASGVLRTVDQKRVILTEHGIAQEKTEGDFVSERPNGTIEHVDKLGYFQYSTDKSGKMLRAIDSRGGEARFVYDKSGQLERAEMRGPDLDGVSIVKPSGPDKSLTIETSDGLKDTFGTDGKRTKRQFNDGSSIEFDPSTGNPVKAKDVYGNERSFSPSGKWPPDEVQVRMAGRADVGIEKRDSTGVLREFDQSKKIFGDTVGYDFQSLARTQSRLDAAGLPTLIVDRLDGTHGERVGVGPLQVTNKFAKEKLLRDSVTLLEPGPLRGEAPLRAEIAKQAAASEMTMRMRREIPPEMFGTREPKVDAITGDGATLVHQEKALLAHAETLPEPQRQDILDNLKAFQERAKEEKLPDAEVAKTLFQANRLLEANPRQLNNGLDGADFVRAAQGLMQGAASPKDTNKGFHGTCNTSILREAMLKTNPSQAGQIAADAMTAKNGVYTAPDGQKIQLDPASMKGDAEARESSQNPAAAAKVGWRNQLGLVLDHVLVNYGHQKNIKAADKLPPSHLVGVVYTQGRPVGPKDTGERLTLPKQLTRGSSAGFNTDMVADVGKVFLKRDCLITNRDTDSGATKSVIVTEQAEFDKAVTDALPGGIGIAVNDKHPAFDDGNRRGGGHVEMVTDTKQIGGQAYYHVSGQEGYSSDRWIAAKDVFNAGQLEAQWNSKIQPIYFDKKGPDGRTIKDTDGKPVVELREDFRPAAPAATSIPKTPFDYYGDPDSALVSVSRQPLEVANPAAFSLRPADVSAPIDAPTALEKSAGLTLAKENQEIAEAQARFLDRSSTSADRHDAVTALESQLTKQVGAAREQLSVQIAEMKLSAAAQDLMQAKDSTAAVAALQAVVTHASANPSSAQSVRLLAQLGGAKGVEAMVARLSGNDASARTKAVNDVIALVEPGVTESLNRQRLERLTGALSSEPKLDDLEKLEKAFSDEVVALTGQAQAGKAGAAESLAAAKGWSDLVGTTRALNEIAAARVDNPESARKAGLAVERLVSQSAAGNPSAHAALVALAANSKSLPADASASKSDKPELPPLNVSGLNSRLLNVARIKAIQELEREVGGAGGKIDSADAKMLTTALATAQAEGNTLFTSLLQRPVQMALRGQGREQVLDAMGKAIIDGVPGATEFARQFAQLATTKQLQQTLPSLETGAANGDQASTRVLAAIIASPELGQKAKQALLNVAKDEKLRALVVESVVEAARDGRGGTLTTLAELGKLDPTVARSAATLVRAGLDSPKAHIQRDAVKAITASAANWTPDDIASVKSHLTADMVRALQALPKDTLDKYREPFIEALKPALTSDAGIANAGKREAAIEAIASLGGAPELLKSGLEVQVDGKQKGRFSVSDVDGTTYQFRSDDKGATLQSLSRKDGSSVSYSFDSAGQIKERVEHDGKGTTATSDNHGNLTRVETPRGDVRTFDVATSADGADYVKRMFDTTGTEWKATDDRGTGYARTGTTDRVQAPLTAKPNGDYAFVTANQTKIESLASDNSIVVSDLLIADVDKQQKVRINQDNSAIIYEQGKVSKTTDVNGQQTGYKNVSPDGQPGAIKEGDVTWTTKDNVTWTSDKGQTRRQKEVVGSDGTRTTTVLDDQGQATKEITRRLDGSSVTKDTFGRVEQVTDRFGNGVKFGYKDAADKQPSSMDKSTPPSVSEKWQTVDGKNWKRDGAKESQPMNVTVNSDGSYTKNQGKLVETKHTNGSVEVNNGGKVHFEIRNSDGSVAIKNRAGLIVETVDKHGSRRLYSRDDSGAITGITEPTGEILTRKPGSDEWTSSDKSKPPRTFIPEVNERGIYQERSADSVRVFKTDGSEFTFDKKGSVTEVLESERINAGTVEKSTKSLAQTLSQQKTDVPTVIKALQGKSDLERREIAAAYEKQTGTKLETALRAKLYGADLERANSELNRQGVVGPRIRRAYEHDDKGIVKVLEGPIGKEKAYTRTKAAEGDNSAEWIGPDKKPFVGNFTVMGDGTSEQTNAFLGTRTIRTTDSKVNVYKDKELISSDSGDGYLRERRLIADPADATKTIRITDVHAPDKSMRSYQDGKGLIGIRNADGSAVSLSDGMVTSVTGAYGKPIAQFKYDAERKVTNYADPQGRWHKIGPNEKASVSVQQGDDGKVAVDITIQNDSAKKQTKINMDGTTQIRDHAALLTYNREGYLSGSKNTATGIEYKFTRVKGSIESTERIVNGKSEGQWTRVPGQKDLFSCGKQLWRGQTDLNEKTGAYHERQDGEMGHERYFHPSKAEVVVDPTEVSKAVEAIEYACNGGIGAGTDEEGIKRALTSLPHLEQRERLESMYESRYKHSLESEFRQEMGGAQLAECMNKLRATSHKTDYAGDILQAQAEMRQYVEGRSGADCETAIRRTLSPRTEAEIKALDRDFQERQRSINVDGTSVQTLKAALVDDTRLSEGTRKANEIYLKGADKRGTQDFLDLADIGIKQGNIEIFQEAWMGATEAAREKFLTEVRDGKSGDDRMSAAFGASWRSFWMSSNLERAKDYHQNGGELSIATQIRENSTWLGDNETAIENGLKAMSDSQRQMYIRGREIDRAGGHLAPLNPTEQRQFDRGRELVLQDKKSTDANLKPADKSAIEVFEKRRHDERSKEYYIQANAAMNGCAGHFLSSDSQAIEHAKWHDMAMRKGGSLVAQLAYHNSAFWFDSSTHDVMNTIEKMSSTDLERMKREPEYKAQVFQVVRTFTNGSETDPTSEVSRTVALLEKKLGTEADTSRGKALAESGFDSTKLSAKDKTNFDTYQGFGPGADTKRMTAEQKTSYESGKKVFDDVAAFDFYKKYDLGKTVFGKGLDPSKVTPDQVRSLQAYDHFGPGADTSKLTADEKTQYDLGQSLRKDLAALEFYKKESFKASEISGRRDVIGAIDDNVRWYNNNEDNIYEALTKMTPKEVHDYQHNVDDFKVKLDAKVESVLDSAGLSTAERSVARGLLAQAAEGKQPKFDIMDKLNKHASFTFTVTGDIVRDIEQAFRDDPSMQARVSKPRSATELKALYEQAIQLPEGVQGTLAAAQKEGKLDQRVKDLATRWAMPAEQLKQSFDAAQALPVGYLQQIHDAKNAGSLNSLLQTLSKQELQFSRQFKSTAERALGPSDYFTFGRPLINGTLDAETRMRANEGIFDDNEQGFFKDAASVSPAMRQKLLADEGLRDRAFYNLSSDERQIAENVLRQGEMRNEDKLRSYMVGWGTSEAEMTAVFAELKDRDKVKDAIMKRENITADAVTDAMVSDAINTQLADLRRDYANKYGETLDVRMRAELSGSDWRDVRRGSNWEGQNATEVLNDATKEYWESQGWGASLNDAIGWDGTTGQTYSLYGRAIAMQVEGVLDPGKAPTMEAALELKAAMEIGVDASIDSQNQLVDAVVDTAITLAAVLAAIPSAGASVVAYAGVLASKIPMAAKIVAAAVRVAAVVAAIPGVTETISGGAKVLQYGQKAYSAVAGTASAQTAAGYTGRVTSAAGRWAVAHPNMAWGLGGGAAKTFAKGALVADHGGIGDHAEAFASGFASAYFNADIAVGPFAGRAAERAASKIAGEMLEHGGKDLVAAAGQEVVEEAVKKVGGEVIEAGAEKTVKGRLTSLVDEAVQHQNVGQAQAAMREMAEGLVNKQITGEARDLLVTAAERKIGQAFDAAVKEELEHTMRQFANALVWNMKQGALGGGASSLVGLNPDASLEENLSAVVSGSVMGGVAAGGFTTALSAAGAVGSRLLRSTEKVAAESVSPALAAAADGTDSAIAHGNDGPTVHAKPGEPALHGKAPETVVLKHGADAATVPIPYRLDHLSAGDQLRILETELGQPELGTITSKELKPEYKDKSPSELQKLFAENGIIKDGKVDSEAYNKECLCDSKPENVRIYKHPRLDTTIVEPESQFALHDNVRLIRKGLTSQDSAERLAAEAASKEFPGWERVTLPEDVVKQLESLPDRGQSLKQVKFSDKPSPGDARLTVEHAGPHDGKPFVSGANYDRSTGEITIFNGTTPRSLERTVKHEWGHSLEDKYPDERKVFELARIVDQKGGKPYYDIPYASYDAKTGGAEDFAVHTEVILGDPTACDKMLEAVKGTPAQYKMLAIAQTIQRSVDDAKANIGDLHLDAAGTVSELKRLADIQDKLAKVRDTLKPDALRDLTKVISSASEASDEFTAAARLMRAFGDSDNANELLRIASNHSDRDLAKQIYLEASAMYGGSVPEAQLMALSQARGPLMETALLARINDSKGVIGAEDIYARIESGEIQELVKGGVLSRQVLDRAIAQASGENLDVMNNVLHHVKDRPDIHDRLLLDLIADNKSPFAERALEVIRAEGLSSSYGRSLLLLTKDSSLSALAQSADLVERARLLPKGTRLSGTSPRGFEDVLAEDLADVLKPTISAEQDVFKLARAGQIDGRVVDDWKPQVQSAMLGDSASFEKMVDAAKGTPEQFRLLAMATALEQSVQKARAALDNGTPATSGPEFDLARLAELQKRVEHTRSVLTADARQGLAGIITNPATHPDDALKAIQMLTDFGDADAANELLRLAASQADYTLAFAMNLGAKKINRGLADGSTGLGQVLDLPSDAVPANLQAPNPVTHQVAGSPQSGDGQVSSAVPAAKMRQPEKVARVAADADIDVHAGDSVFEAAQGPRPEMPNLRPVELVTHQSQAASVVEHLDNGEVLLYQPSRADLHATAHPAPKDLDTNARYNKLQVDGIDGKRINDSFYYDTETERYFKVSKTPSGERVQFDANEIVVASRSAVLAREIPNGLLGHRLDRLSDGEQLEALGKELGEGQLGEHKFQELKPEYKKMTPSQLKAAFEEKGLINSDGTIKGAEYKKECLVDSEELQADAVRIYKPVGRKTSIIVPESEVPTHEAVRFIRQSLDSDDPVVRLGAKAMMQVVPQWRAVVLPEDILKSLDSLPDKGDGVAVVRTSIKQSSNNAARTVEYSDPARMDGRRFVAAAQADRSAREITLFPGTTMRDLDETISHEWAHMLEQMAPEERLAFDIGRNIELRSGQAPYYASHYASFDAGGPLHSGGAEDWAVTIGEVMLGDTTAFVNMIDTVKGTPAQYKMLAAASALDNSTLERRAAAAEAIAAASPGHPDHVAESELKRLNKIHERAVYVQSRLEDDAKVALVSVITNSQSPKADVIEAVRMFGRIGDRVKAADALLKMAPQQSDSVLVNLIYEQSKKCYGGTFPEQQLLALSRERGPLQNAALRDISNHTDTPVCQDVLARIKSGEIPQLVREGHLDSVILENLIMDTKVGGMEVMDDVVRHLNDSPEIRDGILTCVLREDDPRCAARAISLIKENGLHPSQLEGFIDATDQRGRSTYAETSEYLRSRIKSGEIQQLVKDGIVEQNMLYRAVVADADGTIERLDDIVRHLADAPEIRDDLLIAMVREDFPDLRAGHALDLIKANGLHPTLIDEFIEVTQNQDLSTFGRSAEIAKDISAARDLRQQNSSARRRNAGSDSATTADASTPKPAADSVPTDAKAGERLPPATDSRRPASVTADDSMPRESMQRRPVDDLKQARADLDTIAAISDVNVDRVSEIQTKIDETFKKGKIPQDISEAMSDLASGRFPAEHANLLLDAIQTKLRMPDVPTDLGRLGVDAHYRIEIAEHELIRRNPGYVFDEERLLDLSYQIAQKFNDPPLTKADFRGIMPDDPADSKLAAEFLEKMGTNMDSRQLDAKLRDLHEYLTLSDIPVDKSLTVYVADGQSSGNALAYLLRKNNPSLSIEIKTLDDSMVATMLSGGVPQHGLLLDDISSLSAQQKKALGGVEKLAVADMGGFDKGINLYDFANAKMMGNGPMKARMESLVTEAKQLMAQNSGMTESEAVSRVLRGGSPDDLAKAAREVNSNAEVMNVDHDLPKRAHRAGASDDPNYRAESIYLELTEKGLISDSQVLSYLDSFTGADQVAAAYMLKYGTQFHSYPEIMKQNVALRGEIEKQLLPGQTMDDVVIVTGIDKNGSSYMMQHLFAKANGIGPSQFVSLGDIKSNSVNLDGKTVVYLDDFSCSGKQTFDNIADSKGAIRKTGAEKVIVATLGSFQHGANPWNGLAPDGFVGLASVQTPDSFYSDRNLVDTGLAFLFKPDVLQRIGKTSEWSKSKVHTAVITPYGGPNNNIKFIFDLIRAVNLPAKTK